MYKKNFFYINYYFFIRLNYIMDLIKCNFCLKLFTSKSIKKHKNICKVYKITKNTNNTNNKTKLNNNKNNIKLSFEQNNIKNNKNDYFNNIPEDCIKIIFDFYKDDNPFITSKRLHRNLYYVAITCKRLYQIFYPKYDLNNSYLKEVKNKIFFKDVIKNYHLNYQDVKDIKHEIIHRENRTLKLYKKVDILDICLVKYGSYINFLNIIQSKNETYKHSFYWMCNDRKEKYDYLFNKYNLKNSNLYDRYLSYIHFTIPNLNKIEKILINENNSKNKIIDEI